VLRRVDWARAFEEVRKASGDVVDVDVVAADVVSENASAHSYRR